MAVSAGGCSAGGVGERADELVQPLEALAVLPARVDSAVLHQYDGAPRTPDADDPAIWVNRKNPDESLVLGTLKDRGLLVLDLGRRVVQTVLPPNRPAVSSEDPPVAGSQPEAGTTACSESQSGETFGRFNNVDVISKLRSRRDYTSCSPPAFCCRPDKKTARSDHSTTPCVLT